MNHFTTDPTINPAPSRRTVLRAGATGIAGLGAASALAACGGNAPSATSGSSSSADLIGHGSHEVLAAERARHTTGRLVTRTLTAAATTIDLAGTRARTSAFDSNIPAEPIRATVGDQLRVDVHNQLEVPTSVHWHGLALRNDMDGVPGLTMPAIKPGASFRYQFTLPDPGTYWFHPHVGVQLDTGLIGALIIEDPNEPLDYDAEHVLVLDDWTDGVGKTPDEVLADLRRNGMKSMSGMSSSGGSSGMGGMSGSSGMNGMASPGMGVSAQNPLGKDTGDVRYPFHLINGRPAKDPTMVSAKPGQRLRLRLVNAGSDTAYRFALAGHRLTVVAADGYPVQPVEVDTLVLGMGERYDVLVTVTGGAHAIVARPEGKPDAPALAVLRVGNGSSRTPAPQARELTGRLLTYADLRPTRAVAMPAAKPDRTLDVDLQMRNGGRQWVINGTSYANRKPLQVRPGERVRLRLRNHSMMFHPMHLHGHTFALVQHGRPGVRKDTINVLPMQALEVDVVADNPGQWLVHCHNAYHGELGMMTTFSYLRR